MAGLSKNLSVPYFTQPTPITCQSTVLKMMSSYLEQHVVHAVALQVAPQQPLLALGVEPAGRLGRSGVLGGAGSVACALRWLEHHAGIFRRSHASRKWGVPHPG